MKWRTLITGLLLCTLCTGHASALEYTVDEAEDYQFGPVRNCKKISCQNKPDIV